MPAKKLLFVGDFCATTGFEKVNRSLLERLDPDQWEVFILGINATGDYHPMQRRFRIWPAGLQGSDAFGVRRFPSLVAFLKPDLIVINQDSWNIPLYLEAWHQTHGAEAKLPPVIAYCPPDAPNQHHAGRMSADVSLLMCPTQFGVTECQQGGYVGPTFVLPYGVDLSIYRPQDRAAARASLGLPADAFIVGRADRNAPRKRYDLMIDYWHAWWEAEGKPDNAYLYLHCAPVDVGWDLPQLLRRYGLSKRTFFTASDLHPSNLGPEERLARIYNAWDVHLSTTMGEGGGLVALESMACGIPQILPEWAALGEWAKDAAYLVPCTSTQVSVGGINTIGGIADKTAVIEALRGLYRLPTLRRDLGEKALRCAQQPHYRWDILAQWFGQVCQEVVDGRFEESVGPGTRYSAA